MDQDVGSRGAEDAFGEFGFSYALGMLRMRMHMHLYLHVPLRLYLHMHVPVRTGNVERINHDFDIFDDDE